MERRRSLPEPLRVSGRILVDPESIMDAGWRHLRGQVLRHRRLYIVAEAEPAAGDRLRRTIGCGARFRRAHVGLRLRRAHERHRRTARRSGAAHSGAFGDAPALGRRLYAPQRERRGDHGGSGSQECLFLGAARDVAIKDFLHISGLDANRADYATLDPTTVTSMSVPPIAASFADVATPLDRLAEHGTRGVAVTLPDFEHDAPRSIENVRPRLRSRHAVSALRQPSLPSSRKGAGKSLIRHPFDCFAMRRSAPLMRRAGW